MLKPFTWGALALCLFAQAAQSQESPGGPRAEVSLSNDTLEARYIDSGRRVGVEERSRVSAAFFLSEERDIVLYGDLLFPITFGWDRLDMSIGPRAYAAREPRLASSSTVAAGSPSRVARSTRRTFSRSAPPTTSPISARASSWALRSE